MDSGEMKRVSCALARMHLLLSDPDYGWDVTRSLKFLPCNFPVVMEQNVELCGELPLLCVAFVGMSYHSNRSGKYDRSICMLVDS